MKKETQQLSLIPAWMPGDLVTVKSTGLVGTILSPVSWEMDIWWLDVGSSMPVRVHALEMIKYETQP